MLSFHRAYPGKRGAVADFRDAHSGSAEIGQIIFHFFEHFDRHGEGPALKLNTRFICILLKTQREDVPWDELLLFSQCHQFSRCQSVVSIKTLFIHLRDESTRDTTQIALRPSLVSCNGHVPEDSSSSPPKRKDNNALTVHTSHRLSEKVLLSLLHHRLFLMAGL